MISATPPPTESIGRNSAPSPGLRPIDSLVSIGSFDSLELRGMAKWIKGPSR
jgi:hypothetical protein